MNFGVKLAVFSIFVSIAFATSSAQAITANEFGTAFIELNPTYPKPNQSVRATVSSFALDLNRADITWIVNGRVVEQGTGEKSIGFETGPLGSTTSIEVRVTDGNINLSDSISLTPAEVNILWESQTYTPNLYKGRALHSSQSVVRVVAIPEISRNGSRVSPGSLIYEWKIDGNPIVERSGYGENTLSFIGAKKFGRNIVEVVVSTRDGEIFARNNVVIRTVDPEIIVYEDKPLLGTEYTDPIGATIQMISREISLRVEPFYFSLNELTGDGINYDWKVNGQSFEPENDPLLIVIRAGDEPGQATLSLNLDNPKRSLQDAVKTFRVLFGQFI